MQLLIPQILLIYANIWLDLNRDNNNKNNNSPLLLENEAAAAISISSAETA
jgi:hypothetical protein